MLSPISIKKTIELYEVCLQVDLELQFAIQIIAQLPHFEASLFIERVVRVPFDLFANLTLHKLFDRFVLVWLEAITYDGQAFRVQTTFLLRRCRGISFVPELVTTQGGQLSAKHIILLLQSILPLPQVSNQLILLGNFLICFRNRALLPTRYAIKQLKALLHSVVLCGFLPL